MRLLNWKSDNSSKTFKGPESEASARMRQTLEALAGLLDQAVNDAQSVDSEFQETLLQTTRQTEASLEQQAAERLKSAVEATEQKTRALVTEELQARFRQELAAAVEAVRSELAAQRVQPTHDLEQLKKAAADWEVERSQLLADRERTSLSLERSREEHNRALAEIDEAAAIALERQIAGAVDRVRALWDSERQQLSAERDRLTADSQKLRREAEEAATLSAQWEIECRRLRNESEDARKLLAEAGSEHVRLSAEVEQAKAAAVLSLSEKSSSVDVKSIYVQITHVEELIQAAKRVIEDPEAELSLVVRKNAERSELEAYLRGLRFAAPPR